MMPGPPETGWLARFINNQGIMNERGSLNIVLAGERAGTRSSAPVTS